PTASSRPASGCSVFAATFADQLPHLRFAFHHLGGEGTFADAGCVSAHNTQHSGQTIRRESGAHNRATSYRAGGRNEWIGTMIDVKQRSLRSFQQNRSALSSGHIQVMSRITDEGAEAFGKSGHFPEDFFGV